MAVNAMSLKCVLRCNANAAHAVDVPGYDLQVPGVDAVPHPAQVVDDHIFGDGTDVQFVGEPVRVGRPPVDADDPVAAGVEAASP